MTDDAANSFMARLAALPRMPERSRPPAPGGFVAPNLTAIEDAVRDATFPISKKDLLDQVGAEDSVVVGGRNVDLRTIIRDLPDDYFETEQEFHDRLQDFYGYEAHGAEAHDLPMPPTGFPEALPRTARSGFDQPNLPEDNA